MTYFVEQKITALVNQYRVYVADEAGNKDALVAFAQQKRFAFKEQLDFYADESKGQVIFTVKAEKAMDIHGKFNVIDDSGQTVGSIKKGFKSSLLRSTWEILQDGQVYLTVAERSLPLAVIRRIWGIVPYIGEIPFFLKFHFDFKTKSGEIVATYDKLTLFRDHYKLEVSDESVFHTVGWQTFAALAVLLDALQGR